jgi:hypothetical protein
MTDKKSYYAIIPADVRYDKKLCANAKLLYGEITALCNEKGYCWASNDYFAQLYEKTEETVSRWISQLIKQNYINAEYIKRGFEITERRIYILDCQKSQPSIDEKVNRSIDEKVKYNTTVNIKSNITQKLHELSIPLTEYFYNVMLKPTRYIKNPPKLYLWYKHIDRLINIDNIDPNHIKNIIDVTVKDDFWKYQIQSTKNFRDKFDRLEMIYKKQKDVDIKRGTDFPEL